MRLFPLVVAVVLLLQGPSTRPADAETGHSRAEVAEALEVLHDWDARRAQAWARSDARQLRSLYLPGSSAARSDVRLLRSYEASGLVVRRIVTQVFGVRVLRRQAGRLTMRVPDRVAGGRVDDGGRELALPSSRPDVRRIDLRRVGGTWRVASVGR